MTPADPDVRLMLRYRDGDAAAFDALYGRHKDALYRYLLGLCLDAATAEDLFQEAWGKLIAARHRYRPTARFSTYLYRVAHNCFVDHYRRRRSRGREEDADAVTLTARDGDPGREAERALARDRLQRLLAELPAEQREAFLLREEGGLSVAEIAAATGVGAETAKSRLRYAYRKLREGFAALSGAAGGREDD
ncbi:MAG: RNA polymerase sigma factor [Gammaproteobacteria bacterium]|jgi:RNA polymerase sigma-70 factor (ECF subfamily)|nr:RNA polymerase sigma factor [Gammaproteobacteria bacterium]